MNGSGEAPSESGKRMIKIRKKKRISPARDMMKMAAFFVLPALIGFAAGHRLAGIVNGAGASGPWSDGAGRFMKHFAPVVSVPGRQADDSFVFSSFESPSDFRLWREMSSRLEPSDQHASDKEHSAAFSFEGGIRMAGMLMEDYFLSRYGLSDWSSFAALTVHVFNPQAGQEQLIIKIKDRLGNEYAQRILVKPGEGAIFRLDLKEASRTVDIGKISYLNIFSWEPDSAKTFYIDDVRLVPGLQKA